jgi:HD-GYP domain-containing protein (c-di-GMP phosphodiesterase class II)
VRSRVLAVADVAEALTAARPYRGPMSADEVLAIMRREAGTALDPRAFAACEAWLPTRALEAAVTRFTKDASGVHGPAPRVPPVR